MNEDYLMDIEDVAEYAEDYTLSTILSWILTGKLQHVGLDAHQVAWFSHNDVYNLLNDLEGN